MVAPFQPPPKPIVESTDEPKRRKTTWWDIFFAILIVIVVLFIGSSMTLSWYVHDNIRTSGNGQGPYPLDDSIELIDSYDRFVPVSQEAYCYAERNGASLHLLEQIEDHVLVEYRTPVVTESAYWIYCPNGIQIVMPLRDWNREVQLNQWVAENQSARVKAERRRREIERRLPNR